MQKKDNFIDPKLNTSQHSTHSNRGASQQRLAKGIKVPWNELIKHRIAQQEIILQSYPDVPLLEENTLKNFEDFTYKLNEQEDFLIEKHEEMKVQFSGHYMTQMNKKLIQENKELKSRVERSMTNKVQDMIQKEKTNQDEKAKNEKDVLIDKLKSEIVVKEKEVEMLKSRQAQEIEDAIKNEAKENENLKKKLQQAEADNKKLQEQIKHSHGQPSEEQAKKHEQQQKQIQDLHQLIKEREDSMAEINKQHKKTLKQQKENNNQIQQHIKSMEKTIEDLQKENDKLNSDYDKLMSHCQDLEDKLKDIKSSKSKSPERDPRFIDEQERQLESDMNFSIELLQSIKKSKQGSSCKKFDNVNRIRLSQSPQELRSNRKSQLDSSGFFCNFSQNPKGVLYLQQELQQIKEQIYQKLQFLQVKLSQEEKNQDDGYGIFRNTKLDISLFLKEEVNHMQILNNLINGIMLQSEEGFKKVHEESIKKQLIPLIENQDLNQSIEDIVQVKLNLQQYFYQQIKENNELIQQENVLYKAEIEQNLDPKLKALIEENQELRSGKVSTEHNAVSLMHNLYYQTKIENDLLKHENEKLHHIVENNKNQFVDEIKKYEEIIEQLSLENNDLLSKSKVLSENLNYLAEEVERIKEDSEKVERENQHVKSQNQKLLKDLEKNQQQVYSPNSTNQFQNEKLYNQGNYGKYRKSLNPEFERADFSRGFYPNHNQNEKYNGNYSPSKQFSSPTQSTSNNLGYYDKPSRIQRDEETQKLNKLINDYKVENEKCTRKINELKEKLANNKTKFYVERNSVRDSQQQHLNNEPQYQSPNNRDMGHYHGQGNGKSQGRGNSHSNNNHTYNHQPNSSSYSHHRYV